MEDKFKLNAVGAGFNAFTRKRNPVVCLRFSRANHACDANATHIYDSTFDVKILFSMRDIQPGEEITTSYSAWDDPTMSIDDTMEDRHAALLNWGIVCPDDCICRREDLQALVRKTRVLEQRLGNQWSDGDPLVLMAVVEGIMGLQQQLDSQWYFRQRTLADAFEIGERCPSLRAKGEQYKRMWLDNQRRCTHPDSEESKGPVPDLPDLPEVPAENLFKVLKLLQSL